MKKIALFGMLASVFLFTSFARAYPIAFAGNLAPEAAGATGSGSVMLEFDVANHLLNIAADWSGLSGTTTVAHIHCCTLIAGTGNAGVAVTPVTLPGFPVGLQAGSYTITLDMTLSTNYTAGFLTNFGGGTTAGAEAALLAGLQAGSAYFNVHTSNFPGGEIRAFPQAVPEPLSISLIAMALLGLFFVQRKKLTGLG